MASLSPTVCCKVRLSKWMGYELSGVSILQCVWQWWMSLYIYSFGDLSFELGLCLDHMPPVSESLCKTRVNFIKTL